MPSNTPSSPMCSGPPPFEDVRGALDTVGQGCCGDSWYLPTNRGASLRPVQLEATVVGDKSGLNQSVKPSVQKVRDSAIVKGDNDGHGDKYDGAGQK